MNLAAARGLAAIHAIPTIVRVLQAFYVGNLNQIQPLSIRKLLKLAPRLLNHPMEILLYFTALYSTAPRISSSYLKRESGNTSAASDTEIVLAIQRFLLHRYQKFSPYVSLQKKIAMLCLSHKNIMKMCNILLYTYTSLLYNVSSFWYWHEYPHCWYISYQHRSDNNGRIDIAVNGIEYMRTTGHLRIIHSEQRFKADVIKQFHCLYATDLLFICMYTVASSTVSVLDDGTRTYVVSSFKRILQRIITT